MVITVGIIDDHESIREGISALINSSPEFQCRVAYASCEEALEKFGSHPPNILLVDIGLEGMSGIEGVKRIKARYPSIDILMLTVYEDNEKIFQSLCAGASGYLLKKTPSDKILDALREVHAGGAPMTGSVARKILDLFKDIAPPSVSTANLTPRETEILEHLVRGSGYKTIAKSLFISVDTVHTHIRNIYEKLQVHSKSAAVAKALRHRLV